MKNDLAMVVVMGVVLYCVRKGIVFYQSRKDAQIFEKLKRRDE